MKPFNCLAADCPIFGPHLLEASAGTGKTFSIEHVFVRLLLEAKEPIQLEEILAVTFTRAAAREMKERIRANIEKALQFLHAGDGAWAYLKPYIGSPDAMRVLESAAALFDRCQIFTIHGFCYRMLKEFAFEANLGFALPDPDGKKGIPQELQQGVSEFLEKGISPTALVPEQAALLLSGFDHLADLTRALLRSERKEANDFTALHEQFRLSMKKWSGAVEKEKLIADFSKARENYKAKKGELESQAEWLARAFESEEDPLPFQKLIWHRGSIFSFFDPENRKVRFKEFPLHYPGFFEWASLHLGPIVEEASDKKKCFQILSQEWHRWKEPIDPGCQPDEILRRMRIAIALQPFRDRVRARYKAAVIDEFQDTDPLQWEIFQKLFLSEEKPLQAFYLVGDPKQSIYRFRSADVYTYFIAKEAIGSDNLYRLDTNYRSSKKLIAALNSIFNRAWLPLPQTGQSIPCLPVHAGGSAETDFPDGKGALHCVVADESDALLAYAVHEIEKLSLPTYSSAAILVKDRYEAQKALDLLRERGIPAIAKSHQPLGETAAFLAVRELLAAAASPNDDSLEKIVRLGPFAREILPFSFWKALLEEKGLVPFFREALSGLAIEGDLRQTIEELFNWEMREGFSFEGLQRFLDDFEKRDAEEGGRRRMEESKDAVQVMTLHISKGLEFDVVFAFGLASRPTKKEKEDVEIDAEKLRQLYVAMTRAKKRLYVPLIRQEKGTLSPMELFRRKVEAEEGDFIAYLKRIENATVEEIASPYHLPPALKKERMEEAGFTRPVAIPFQTCYLNSFTSLAKPKEALHREALKMDETALPRGKETGIAVHEIFETLFSSETPVWQNRIEVDRIAETALAYTPLAAWTQTVQEMVWSVLTLPLFEGFCLAQLQPEQIFAEMEFLYPSGRHFVKGFIDLVFEWEDKYYLIDWKTNDLPESTLAACEREIEAHDYGLQAALYREALRRHLGADGFEDKFGGALYLFVRHGLVYRFNNLKEFGDG